jgi:hypothetical protein
MCPAAVGRDTACKVDWAWVKKPGRWIGRGGDVPGRCIVCVGDEAMKLDGVWGIKPGRGMGRGEVNLGRWIGRGGRS